MPRKKMKAVKKVEAVNSVSDKTLDDIIKAINKGSDDDNAYRILDDDDSLCNDFISTGNFAINYAISGRPITGGFPIGKVTEVFGGEASGKTLLSTMALIETQRRGGISVLIDTEHAFWKDYFVRQGGDANKLLRGTPDSLENVWSDIDEMVEVCRRDSPDKYITIVWDSVAASPTQKELDGDISDSEMGERARINSKGLRKITSKIAKNKITLICINQTRDKIGVMYGNPQTTPGGNAWKFHASCRIEVAKKKDDKLDKREAIGARMTVIKNKVYLPFQSSQYEIWYDRGTNPVSGFIRCGLENGFIESAGAWYTIKGLKKRFQAANVGATFDELLSTNFAGAEHILAKDADSIGSDLFNMNVRYMKEKIALFTGEVLDTKTSIGDEESDD